LIEKKAFKEIAMRTRISLIALTAIISIVCANQRIFADDTAVQKGKEKAMSVKLQWLGHASFKISDGNTVVYIDPWKLKDAPHDATIVLVSHSHYDHYSAEDIAKVSGMTTKLVAAEDVIQKQGKGQVLKPGQSIDVNGVKITGVPAYNPAKQFHPKANNWLGFIIEIAGKRIYYAGDTDLTDEMKALKNIDLALLPAGGTYTMDANEAAEATRQFKPKQAIPYHWGDIVGGQADADKFAKSAACPVKVLSPGGSMTVE
jgi:L-ascorbate metabolism protein UlaG (beta-lactamase superfamily)